MKRIEEFEGLRGLLAMWVFLSHIIAISGYPWSSFKQPFRTLVDGTFAVDVFMTLSGFVVSMLIVTRREPYKLFIGRRLLRLYPAYLVCVAAAIALNVTGVMPKNYADSDLVKHVASHLTMLHGVIPNKVLPHAASAFLNPGWSISTEWQFYLLVPLFFVAFRSRPALAWVGLLALAFVGSRVTGRLGRWDHLAFLPLKLHFFALGIFSCFAFMWIDRRKEHLQGMGPYITVTLLAFALMFSVVTSQLGLYVWLVALGSMLAMRLGGGTAVDRGVTTFLKSKVLQWLGTISYSVYLSHEIMIWISVRLFKGAMPDVPRHFLLLGMLAFTIPVTLFVSHLLFHFVENPAIQFGKRLGKRAAAPGAVAV